MSTLEITASTLFATELVRAALPIVAQKYPQFHGVWSQQNTKMNGESDDQRSGEIVAGFHNGLKVVADCVVYKDDRGYWSSGKVRLRLPDRSTWEAIGMLDLNYRVLIRENSVRKA